MSDQDQLKHIVNQCLTGDRRAQSALFHQYKGTILRLVTRMLGYWDKHETQDVIQQVYVALFKSLSAFRWESSLDTWVYRICSKTCISQIRRKYRQPRPACREESDQALELLADPGDDPAQTLHRRETTAKIHQALDRLHADRRTVFVLFEMEDKSLEEISVIIGAPVGTVKSRLFRARKDMCRLLKDEMEPVRGETVGSLEPVSVG